MTYSPETEIYIAEVKKRGLNIWAMLAIFKRRSKLSPKIPDEVIQSVCKEYLFNKRQLRADFPYFLEVLKRKSFEYFSNKEVEEGQRIKNEPLAIKNIMRQLAKEG